MWRDATNIYSLRLEFQSLTLRTESVQTRLRIGTRGSALALAQTRAVIEALASAHHWEPEEATAKTQIIPIKTTGDRVQDRPLADIGGKGLFAKEIEEALLAGEIDCAVHSLKDMPGALPPGLLIDCVLPREDPRDAFVSKRAATLQDLPIGATVGTSSVRRQAMLLNTRPDLNIIGFRGNVDTRLQRIAQDQVAATVLALAGLKRLGAESNARHIFSEAEHRTARKRFRCANSFRTSQSTRRGPCRHAGTRIPGCPRRFMQNAHCWSGQMARSSYHFIQWLRAVARRQNPL